MLNAWLKSIVKCRKKMISNVLFANTIQYLQHQNIIFFLPAVFLNSLILALEHYRQPEYVEIFLDRANYFFLCLFTLEMVVKLYALGPRVYVRYVGISLSTLCIICKYCFRYLSITVEIRLPRIYFTYSAHLHTMKDKGILCFI